ncbi:MAG: YbaB/EbfC family nucleoid-associated protein [Candidatus Falkowbacteria bacterium]
MFNKLKQIKDLRSQAKTMQSALAQEIVTIEKSGVTVKMNGNMEVLSVVVAEGTSKSTMENGAKDAFNDAVKKMQKIMAQKVQEMGGFPGLS